MYKIYCVQYDAGMCGTDTAELAIGESVDQICDEYWPTVVEYYHQYDHHRGGTVDEDDPDYDEDEYADENIDGAWAEEYDPEKHDGIIFEKVETIAKLQAECDRLNKQ